MNSNTALFQNSEHIYNGIKTMTCLSLIADVVYEE